MGGGSFTFVSYLLIDYVPSYKQYNNYQSNICNICFHIIEDNISRWFSNVVGEVARSYTDSYPSWYSSSTNSRGRNLPDSINRSDFETFNWDSPTSVLNHAFIFPHHLIRLANSYFSEIRQSPNSHEITN